MPIRIVSLLLVCSFLGACGGGGGGNASTGTTGAATAPAAASGAASAPQANAPVAIPQSSTPNVQPIAVAAAPGLTRNMLTTSVTVCAPGTSNCATIDNIQVDTGSQGLRILASALPANLQLAALPSGGQHSRRVRGVRRRLHLGRGAQRGRADGRPTRRRAPGPVDCRPHRADRAVRLRRFGPRHADDHALAQQRHFGRRIVRGGLRQRLREWHPAALVLQLHRERRLPGQQPAARPAGHESGERIRSRQQRRGHRPAGGRRHRRAVDRGIADFRHRHPGR
jgi:Protein of unknown function (DUF3443)